MRSRAALFGLAALAALACRSSSDTVLVVTVTMSGSLPGVTALDVTLLSTAGTAENVYPAPASQTITFPTTLTARLPSRVTGDVMIDVKANDASGAVVAHGRLAQVTLKPGTRQTIVVALDCGGAACATVTPDGGPAPDAAGGDAGSSPTCGNGVIDLGETCDTAIAAGAPGACPRADCDDGLACTTNVRTGDGCTAACAHVEITARVAGDRCCPTGATATDDPDCSPSCGNGTIEAGETCDTAIGASAPGACPAPADCDDHDPCTDDHLISAGTCDAICAHVWRRAQSGTVADGCCPAGAWHEADVDCPASCGDGHVQAGERCDPGIPAGTFGACPTSCDDGDPCTADARSGAGCQVQCAHAAVTAFVSGDGCCPPRATRRTDRDCAPTCGNGVVEPGEACDKGATTTGACPTSCPPSPSACLVSALVGAVDDCTRRCALTPVSACAATADGCCAPGCTAANDPDCSPTCGDGVVQPANGEGCDTAIAAGLPGACPTRCSDGVACTRDLLVAAGTCAATCLSVPITEPIAGDGCCPPGADATLDPDCAAVCGNGVAEPPAETCDYAAGAGACPVTCPAGDACAPVSNDGAVGTCTAACVAHPVTACKAGDGCCPAGCTIEDDADCPETCGDGVLEADEICDRAITAGQPGHCPASCDDHDACTLDWVTGTPSACSRACGHVAITACVTGDGCCPPGCNATSDHDCAAVCGDGKLEAGETCDPPSTCPVACPDDGDPCTHERLVGDAASCSARCDSVPVTTCSGAAVDLCCPTGCSRATDADCAPPQRL
ncbi:MAG TPA: hypothetical protein VHJ20_15320 [Polyangia bacterium]|nr:hypothetical protein [Polyangia bacterium]